MRGPWRCGRFFGVRGVTLFRENFRKSLSEWPTRPQKDPNGFTPEQALFFFLVMAGKKKKKKKNWPTLRKKTFGPMLARPAKPT